MDAGIRLSADALNQFKELQLRKKFHYLIFKIEGASIVVDRALPIEAEFTYDKFIKDLKGMDDEKKDMQGHKEPRYAVLDYHFNTDNGDRSKVVLVCWVHPQAAPRLRMPYASSKDHVKNALQGVHVVIQATDDSEISEAEVRSRCN
eukprot:TRINITY_DN1861_c0_g1_i1.p1 TRINITY_DN1861_c0_g1~~TRINITY_DN1861_c0_g1_i1.p1  ORF type:complete len:169 (+),score=80.88 TRINITY_DN1861_c0_g1_i1:68-508(+)